MSNGQTFCKKKILQYHGCNENRNKSSKESQFSESMEFNLALIFEQENPLDFHLWGYLKDRLCGRVFDNKAELKEAIFF